MNSYFRAFVAGVALLAGLGSSATAQSRAETARERTEYLAWLETATNSPLAAVAQQPVQHGTRLGPPDADIPLQDLAEHRVIVEGKSLKLQTPSGIRAVSAGQRIELGSYALYFTTSPRGPIATVFGRTPRKPAPGYYDYDPAVVFTGRLIPPPKRDRVRVLSPDGIEADATEAGTMAVSLGSPTRLRVRRIRLGTGEESELEIFFRDESNGRGSYPAGRFVNLIPLPDGQYLLDFNRARNPFCAYNSVYPCPAPWRGNALPVALHAGERYAGGGLEPEPPRPEPK
jgi:hypothetical protein